MVVDGEYKGIDPTLKSSRKQHPQDSVVNVGGVPIGSDFFAVIAGPCSVENEEQIVEVAKAVKASGANLLRGGAFKPRTSPYDFQGLGEQGLRLLELARRETGLPLVTECVDARDLPLFENVDMIQIGARNMQNYGLLKAVGAFGKPVLLKRGIASTLREFLLSAEYILAEGNEQLVLCERGVRTFDGLVRNTLDLEAVCLLKELTHLPVIADPSHATGRADLVPPMALAATAAGCDGLIVEVHSDPAHALCDGVQALTPPEFDGLMQKIGKIRGIVKE